MQPQIFILRIHLTSNRIVKKNREFAFRELCRWYRLAFPGIYDAAMAAAKNKCSWKFARIVPVYGQELLAI